MATAQQKIDRAADRIRQFYGRLIPELHRYDDSQALYDDWADVFVHALKWHRVLLFCTCIPLCVLLMRFFHLKTAGMIASGVIGASCMYLAPWLAGRRLRRIFRGRLHARGVYLCIDCGYDVEGTTSCPECGCPHPWPDSRAREDHA